MWSAEMLLHVTVLCLLYQGASFGELGLIYGKPRMANVRVVQRCHIMYLDKYNFRRCLYQTEFSRIQFRVQQVNNLPVFQKLSYIFIAKFVFFFNYINVCKGQEIIKQNQEADKVFIIQEGEIQIIREVYEPKPK